MAKRILSRYSTFGVGGPAKHLTEVHSIEQMAEVLRWCQQVGERYYLVGKGSNTLFDDRGFDGMVLINRIEHFVQEDALFIAGAGLSFPLLGIRAAKAGYAGLEFAAGIPGTVGGAVVMNAGANGKEIADVLESVTVLNPHGELVRLERSALPYSYRTSPFQGGKWVVLEAAFRLVCCPGARARQVELVMQRQQKQPLRDKSVGCIFRNPPHQAAGALIEKCGLKGVRVGGAQVSLLHANFIINTGTATSADIQALIAHIQSTVQAAKGINLQHEVCIAPHR